MKKFKKAPAKHRLSVWVGISLVIVTVSVISGLFLFLYRTVTNDPNRDLQTFCPADGPTSRTVILIDTTDQISLVQKADLMNQLELIIESVPRDGAVEIYSVGPIEPVSPEPLFKKCNPGRGKDIAEWSESPPRVENSWREGFQIPLDALLSTILEAPNATASPILESIQWAAVSAFPPRNDPVIPGTLVIVSDMLQHTNELSFYRSAPDFNSFQSTSLFNQLRAPLAHISIQVLLLQRPDTSLALDKKLIEFWTQYFDRQQSGSVRFLRIAG